MFDFLRKLERSPFLWAVYGLIIATFVGGYMPCVGQGAQDGGGNQAFVKVAGEEIGYQELALGREFAVTEDWLNQLTSKEFAAFLTQIGAGRSVRFLRLDSQAKLTAVLNSFAGLKSPIEADPLQLFNAPPDARSPLEEERIFEDLIEGFLVADLALSIGLDVSSDELAERIMGAYRFSNNEGKFEKARYDAFSNLEAGLESFVRREILRERVIELVRSMVALDPAEVRFYADGAGIKVNLEVIELRVSTLANAIAPTLSDESVAAYLASNEEAVKTFYDAAENANRFGQVEKVPFGGIFFKATAVEGDEAATAKSFDDALARADEARKAIKAIRKTKDEEGNKPSWDEAFKTVAKEKSEDEATKESGGVFPAKTAEELGADAFGGDMASAVFSTKIGRVSKPIKGSAGYWLVIPGEHTEPSPTFEAAKGGIARELLSGDKATESFDATSKELIDAANASPTTSLTEIVVAWRATKGFAADTSAFPVRETGDFARLPETGVAVTPDELGKVPQVGTSRELVEAAFALTSEKPVASRPFQTQDADARFVVRLKSRTEIPAEERTALESSIRERIELMRASQSYRSLVKTLVRTAEKDQTLVRTGAYRALISQAVENLESKQKRATP